MNIKPQRFICMLLSLLLLMAAVSCKNGKDDNDMINELMQNHLKALSDFDIKNYNADTLSGQKQYADSDAVINGCRSVAASIKWSIESISINGRTAIVQVDITLPVNTSDICALALEDVMQQINGGYGSEPSELMTAALKKRSSELSMNTIASEVTLNKIGSRWCIVTDNDTLLAWDDIRITVAAAYSYFDE